MEHEILIKSVDKATKIIEATRKELDEKIKGLQGIIDAIQHLENGLKDGSIEIAIKSSPEDLEKLHVLFGGHIQCRKPHNRG